MMSTNETCRAVPLPGRDNYPQTGGLIFAAFFLENVTELLERKDGCVASVKQEIEMIRDLLKNTLDLHKDCEELKDLFTWFTKVVYEAEYVIDLFLVTSANYFLFKSRLNDIIEELKLIKTKVTGICDKMTHEVQSPRLTLASHARMSPEANAPEINTVIVGFEDVADKIKKQLTEGPQLDIISIVGMPGLGKTTLAKKVYNELKDTASCFDVYSWCCVSQEYQKKELLLDILRHIIEVTDKIERKSERELTELLYRTLCKRKYLIVMDDIWSTEAWDDLKMPFQDNYVGSRIILTTRHNRVASYAKCHSEPHHLRFFRDDECLMLLRKKIFQKEKCPENLMDVCEQIAKKCGGLPLSVVLIAGLLSGSDKKLERWKQVLESLTSYAVDKPKQSMEIIELSYKHLPENLKPCFLYFGAFGEDEEIPALKLKWLWLAEGFVKIHDAKSLEDLAESYLEDLISRNLVMQAKRRSLGKVKACRIHDLLRELCLMKAEGDKFLRYVRGSNELFVLPPSCAECISYEQYRLYIQSDREEFLNWRPSSPQVRSIHFGPLPAQKLTMFHDMSSMLDSFKLLRVLNLERISLGESFSGIELLIHLRYLAVRLRINSVPPSIAKLWNLETLIVKGVRGEILIPMTIWKMVKLRHLHVNRRASFDLVNYSYEDSFPLDKLETLSTPLLSSVDFHLNLRLENLMRRLTNLQKLTFQCEDGYQFRDLDIFVHLESLKILNYGQDPVHCDYRFPAKLKKLTLQSFWFGSEQFEAIGKLLNLEVLKLLRATFEERWWEVRDEEFPSLKVLKFKTVFDFPKWNVSHNSFPNLERLIMWETFSPHIPPRFGYIHTLQAIELPLCSPKTAKSAMAIYETQVEETLNNEFKIFIRIDPSFEIN